MQAHIYTHDTCTFKTRHFTSKIWEQLQFLSGFTLSKCHDKISSTEQAPRKHLLNPIIASFVFIHSPIVSITIKQTICNGLIKQWTCYEGIKGNRKVKGKKYHLYYTWLNSSRAEKKHRASTELGCKKVKQSYTDGDYKVED